MRARGPSEAKVIERDAQQKIEDAEERIDVEHPVGPWVVAQQIGRDDDDAPQHTPKEYGTPASVSERRKDNQGKEGVEEGLVREAPTHGVEQKLLPRYETLQQKSVNTQVEKVGWRRVVEELQEKECYEQGQQMQWVDAGYTGHVE